MSTHSIKKDGLLFYLALLTGFFFLSELSFFIQCNRIYLDYFNFISDNLPIPITILPAIFYFVFAQLLIHTIYCVFVWWMSISIAKFFRFHDKQKIILGVGIWLLGILTILAANQYYFPNSKFSALTSLILFNDTVTDYTFFALLACSAIFILLALLRFFLLFLFFTALAAYLLLLNSSPIIHDGATANQPNIIIVGMDALRPDFLSFFGSERATPHLDALLAQATVFSEAVTPLARTFPSWISTLTGQYPRQTGIRFNLAKQNELSSLETLPAILKQHGYETIYATDETRFSNIEKNIGFNHIITPPQGVNDFLLGSFNDFPFSNLLVNTIIGKCLFPYSYANRAAYITYEPKTFLNLLKPALKQAREKPLFLTVHFCLAHYPYIFAKPAADELSVQARYAESVLGLDKQIGDFFALLTKYHILDHAIVILLSDHGEALEFPGDRITEAALFKPVAPIPKFYPQSLDQEAINQSAGHGTDVLGLPQYHTLLAFKFYGTENRQARVLPGTVSLLDIKPTVLELIRLAPAKYQNAGISLTSLIENKQENIPKRHLFLESDYSPESIRTVYPEVSKVILEGVEVFQIDPITLKLTVKDSMANMIIHSKQYADIYGEWILASYPLNNHQRMPILINLVSGEWTNDLQSPFAKHSPAAAMLAALKAFFGNEIT